MESKDIYSEIRFPNPVINLPEINQMNKDLKSFMWILAFILLYFYATAGIVKLFWNTKNEYMFSEGVLPLVYLYVFFYLKLAVFKNDNSFWLCVY